MIILFLSNFKPFVRTNMGVVFLKFFKYLPIESIPMELTAITIRSHLKYRISEENLCITNFFDKFIFKAG